MARSFTRELEIGHLGGGGDGIAETADGRFYVPYTVPGDRVGVRVGPEVGQGRRCELVELIRPGPDRAEPGCAHFHACGGCALQHLSAAAYIAWKTEQLRIALSRRNIEADILPMQAAPAGDRRRADFALRKVGKRAVLGFHEAHSNRIVDLKECLVLRPELVALAEPLRLVFADLLPAGRGLDLKLNLCANGVDLLIAGPFELDLQGRQSLVDLADSEDIARVSWTDGAGRMETIVARRTPVVRFGGTEVAPPPGAFLQASLAIEAAMTRSVLAAAGQAARIADLFAGCGTFSFPLAQQADVLAVEGDEAALSALTLAANAGGRRVKALRRDLVRRPLDGTELKEFDAVLFDPPRAGAREQASRLAASRVPLVIGVSCAPGTFARDARLLLDGGYRLVSVEPFDQFRWTVHTELVGLFRRD